MIRNTRDLSIVQEDIDKLVDWSREWKLKFNSKKCKFMIIGTRNSSLCSNVKFFMDNGDSRHEIEETTVERDLGVTINNKLKWNNHIDKAVLVANNMICKLKNSFKYWDAVSFNKLYSAFVRPHLEYCTSVWNPILKKDIAKLEKVQRRATKLVPNLRHLSYETRLANIGISTLEERRRRGDIIQYYKLNKGYNVAKLHEHQLHQPNGPTTRSKSRSQLIVKQLTKIKAREQFFSNRIATDWNELPENVINSASLNSFKNNLDKFRKQQLGSLMTTIVE